ncbi:hypothetical protein CARUB_v100032511mg, partial [Capsella rubella]
FDRDMAQDDGNQNFDTKYTKIYVGGLPWRTRTDGLRTYFRQFGEIIHANVVCNRYTGRSEGYGFVTFRHAESATRACQNPNPIVEGREAKCQLAYFGARVYNNQNVDQQLQVATYVPNWDQFAPRYHTHGYVPYGCWTHHNPYYWNWNWNQPDF